MALLTSTTEAVDKKERSGYKSDWPTERDAVVREPRGSTKAPTLPITAESIAGSKHMTRRRLKAGWRLGNQLECKVNGYLAFRDKVDFATTLGYNWLILVHDPSVTMNAPNTTRTSRDNTRPSHHGVR